MDHCRTGQIHSTFSVPAAQWSQIRIRKVIPTICLLNNELQNKLEALRSDIQSLSPASITRTVEHHESVDDDPKTVRPIALVTLRSNRMVDSLTFTYVDGGQSDQHGAQGGMEHKFRLDSGNVAPQLPHDDHLLRRQASISRR